MKRIIILVFMFVVAIGFSQEKKIYDFPDVKEIFLRGMIATELMSASSHRFGDRISFKLDFYQDFMSSMADWFEYFQEVNKLLKKISEENNIEIRR